MTSQNHDPSAERDGEAQPREVEDETVQDGAPQAAAGAGGDDTEGHVRLEEV